MTGRSFGPGTVLAGRFTLDDLLDENDGARFWRATDRTLARSVAVHVLPDTDPRADLLLTAARTSALVSDGHLLRVLDAAATDGVVYVVNEWGSGVSLDRILADGPLSPRRAAWVVKEVAEAITTAHRNGVAHARLLPENVMISEAGAVKLIGFVIDAVLRSEPGSQPRRVAGGGSISAHESDVVNLAALLYAALVGRWPGTEGSTIPAAPAEHGRPLRPRQVRAGVPRPLDAICERVLNAGAHPGMLPIESAHEICAALSDYIGDPGAAGPVGGPAGGPPGEVEDPRTEPTAVLDRVGLTTDRDQDRDRDQDTSDLAATGAMPAAGVATVDPEATQAGAPVFFDSDGGIGAMFTSESRGLRGDGSDPAGEVRAAHPYSPAPPPPEQPERPLFADGPPAAAGEGGGRRGGARTAAALGEEPLSFTGRQRSTGAGNGSVPRSWGPDAAGPPRDDGSWDAEEREEALPGRTWLRLAVVLALVLVVVVGMVLAFNLGRGPGSQPTPAQGSGGSSSSAAPASVPVPISGVTDFDPEGDPPEENPDLAPLAVDGKTGTAWRTVTYLGNPKLGGLKSGVGLLVDLGKPAKVGDVKLTLLGSPTSVEILAASGAGTAPTSTTGLRRVARADGAGTRADLKLTRPVTTRWLVVWLTSLPSVPGGYQGQVAEISVRS